MLEQIINCYLGKLIKKTMANLFIANIQCFDGSVVCTYNHILYVRNNIYQLR